MRTARGGNLFRRLRTRSDSRKRGHNLEAEIRVETLGRDLAGALGNQLDLAHRAAR